MPAATDPALSLSVALGVCFACATVRAKPRLTTAMNAILRRIALPSFTVRRPEPNTLVSTDSQLLDGIPSFQQQRAVLTAIVTGYHRHRFAWLFVSLLLTLGAGGTIQALAPRHNVLPFLLGVNLLAAIASVAQERDMRLPLALGMAFVLTRLVLAALGIPGMLALSDGVWATAVVLAMVTSVRHAFGRGIVDTERILAALDAYLL